MARVFIVALAMLAGYFACTLARPYTSKPEYIDEVKKTPHAGRDWFLGRPMPADEGESSDTFETDIKLNPDQKKALDLSDNTRWKRKASKNVTHLWPGNIVPYELNSTDFTTSQIAIIKQGLAHWEDETCIRFQTWNGNASLPHISIGKLDGCWSSVGLQGAKQNVSIGAGCFEIGTVAHEIGHAVGFWHEQSRTDRDERVRVNWDNIKTDKQFNFARKHIDEIMTNVEYDETSLMHYTSVKHQPHLPKPSNLGFCRSPSHSKLANRLYKCDINCSGNSPCQNGGFRLQNCTCKCPDEWSGATCETAKDVNSQVKTVIVEGNGEIVSHAAYYENADYPISFENFTLIKAGPGKKITLTFKEFAVEGADGCTYDFVEIIGVNGHPFRTTKHCGGLPQTVTGDEILVHFKSDESVTKRGFPATYVTEVVTEPKSCTALESDPQFRGSCSRYVWLEPGTAQRVASPGYPGNYPTFTECDYSIESTNKTVTIDIKFDAFNTEQGYDYLNVTYYDTNGRHIKTYDGTILPVLSGSYQMIALKFYSDQSNTAGGFLATACAHY